jgi:aminotransferase
MNRLDYFEEYWRNVNEMNRKSSGGVLNLGMGMPPPDVFTSPRLLVQKLHESIDYGDYNLYVPPEGDVECLWEIAEYENSQLPPGARRYDADSVMLVPGGIQAFSAILTALASADDPILTPVPSYFSLSAQSERHAPTVALPCDDELNFRADDLKLAIADVERLGLMWLCQPNNPTGRYIPRAELGQMIDVAVERGCPLVLDESCDNYRFGRYEGLPHNIGSERVIRIRTFSKDPNFAGYRLGYLLADPHILERLKHVVPMLYGNPTVMASRAVLAEFRMRNGKIQDDGDYQRTTQANFDRMKQSRDYLYTRLRGWDRVEEVIEPEACYYLYARFRFPGNSLDLCRRLLREEMLDVVPGSVFGVPADEASIRICFARTTDVLRDGLNRIARVVG